MFQFNRPVSENNAKEGLKHDLCLKSLHFLKLFSHFSAERAGQTSEGEFGR